MITSVFCILGAYLLGSIPFGLLVGKLAGTDVREHGSGNIGFTNVVRVCGFARGLPVLILDVAKGAAPVLLAARFGPDILGDAPDWAAPTLAVVCGLAAVLGHNFTVFLRFRGGKGVATSAGVLLALMPAATACALAVFLLTLAATRYVSVSSTCAAVAVVIARLLSADAPLSREALPATALTWLVCLLVVVRHRANYRRLLAGTENRIGRKREAGAPADDDAAGAESGDDQTPDDEAEDP